MSELLDDIRAAFHLVEEEEGDGTPEVIDEDEVQPGTFGQYRYAKGVMQVILRRGYRWYAGATLPTDSRELLEFTSEQMIFPIIAASLEAFTAGVMVNHRSDSLVRESWENNHLDNLFRDEKFLAAARTMARGFADDPEIWAHFHAHVNEGLEMISHASGFVHREQPEKVWDLWLIGGHQITIAAYQAGGRMGTSWYERDVLDGILIATEETTDGSEAEDAGSS